MKNCSQNFLKYKKNNLIFCKSILLFCLKKYKTKESFCLKSAVVAWYIYTYSKQN